MTDSLKESIENALEQLYGEKIAVKAGIAMAGGCINSAMSISTSKGDTLLLKYNPNLPHEVFQAEAIGLQELSKAKALRIPDVICYSSNDSKDTPFILMEYLQSSAKKKNFYEEFGRQFAQLHQTTEKQYGFPSNNFIGSSPQENTQMENWVDFFREKRLGFQIELAKKNHLWDASVEKLWEKLSSKLDDLIGVPRENPSLLHGDLWSGNYLVGPSGEACIIDPAVYYGHREADLAMTELFGGFDTAFYDAYREMYPIETGYDDRVPIYKLYHLLNHLNIFGRSYESGVRSILERYAK